MLATAMQMIKVLYSGHNAKCSTEGKKKKEKKKTHNQVIGAHKPGELITVWQKS